MKYVWQFCIILLVTFLGEMLHELLPLPVPTGIYGMAFMFLALWLKIIPLSAVEDTADFLIEIMPLMFIPAVVRLMSTWTEIKPMLLPSVIAITVVTAVVMGAAGLGAQGIQRLDEKRGGRNK